MILQVTNAQEALTVAIQMEKRAIGLYERAQMLFSTPKVADALQWLLEEERHHLKRLSPCWVTRAQWMKRACFLHRPRMCYIPAG